MKNGVNNLDIFIMSNNKFEDKAVAWLVHLEVQLSEIPSLFPSFLTIFGFVLGLTSFLDGNKAAAAPGITSSPAKPRVQKWPSVFLHI